MSENEIPPAAPMVESTVPPIEPKSFRARFHATGESFALVVLKNLFLTVITLGIYAAWAKTNRRKFLWQNAEFEGQRLVYTGTGREIAVGYAKVFGVYILVVMASELLRKLPAPMPIVVQFLTTLLFINLIGFAIYASRAYLMRVTRYRGVRLGLDPQGRFLYMRTFGLGWVARILTLGIYGPIVSNRLYGIMTRHSRVGSSYLRYDGTDREAFQIFLKSLPWIVLTLGIYFFWYRAEVLKFRASHTSFESAVAKYEVSGPDLFKLHIGNLLLLLVTLGLAFPWVVVRSIAFAVDRVSMNGVIPFAQILERASSGDALGDAAADVLDVDFAM